MLPSVRTSASACSRIDSNVFERWLISRIDMPTPGSASRSRWISSRTGTGSTAGPAAKLKTRCTVVIGRLFDQPRNHFRAFVANCSDGDKVEVQNIRVSITNRPQQSLRRRTVEVDSRNGGLGSIENHVLGFLNVDVPRSQMVEHVRE